MICENIVCEKCKAEGKTGSVRNTGMSKTILACQMFVDDQGRLHYHDPNVTYAEYRCDNWHVWKTESTTPCWCGWPAEPAAPMSAPLGKDDVVRLVGEVVRVLTAENARLRALLDEAEGIVRDYSPGHTVWLDAVAAERKP